MNTTGFQLRLIVPWKAILLLLGGLAGLITVLFGEIIYNANHHIVGTIGDVAWFVLVFFGGGYGLIQVGKKVCTYAAHVAVGEKKIAIETDDGAIQNIFYNDILSYRYQVFNGGYELRIKLLNGEVQKLNAGGQLLSAVDTAAFANMGLAFESAIARYQQQKGDFVPALREKTFLKNQRRRSS